MSVTPSDVCERTAPVAVYVNDTESELPLCDAVLLDMIPGARYVFVVTIPARSVDEVSAPLMSYVNVSVWPSASVMLVLFPKRSYVYVTVAPPVVCVSTFPRAS